MKNKVENKQNSKQLNILAVIRRFSNWFNRNFICSTIFSKGHIPEPYLAETECVIHTRRCKRCKATLGLGKWKHIPPPPNSTPEQIKIFEKYREEQLNEIRRSVQTCV
jgi:hypothetical protein